MNKLDDLKYAAKLDSKNMLGSIEKLSDQVKEIYNQTKKFKLPAKYKKIDRVVVFGMGGSALGAHLIRSVFYSSIKMPFGIVNGYESPASVGKNTLVIASSYSGNTEEVVSAFFSAKKRGAKIVCISAGGELDKLAVKFKLPSIKFTTKNNPCGSPRMGLGYSIIGLAVILSRAGLIRFGEKEYKSVISAISKAKKEFGILAKSNKIKELAAKADNRTVWFVASGFLSGNAHIAANQMNENAKRFGGYFHIPEMNHHLLEGMLNPRTNKSDIIFILVKSGLYESRVNKRFKVTENVFDKNNIKRASVVLKAKSALEQSFEMLVISSYLSFYSAVLGGIDPTAIPFVDYFKQALKK